MNFDLEVWRVDNRPHINFLKFYDERVTYKVKSTVHRFSVVQRIDIGLQNAPSSKVCLSYNEFVFLEATDGYYN